MSNESSDDDIARYSLSRLAALQRGAADPFVAESLSDLNDVAMRRLASLGIATAEQITESIKSSTDALLVPADGVNRPTQNWILERVLSDVALRLIRIGATPVDGVKIAALQTRTPNAGAATGIVANMITVNFHMLIFAHLLAKACAPIVSAEAPILVAEGAGNSAFHHIPYASYKLALLNMAELIVAHVINRDIASAPTETPPGWPYWPLALSWTSAIEVFVVAHEYGHLLHGQENPGRHLPPNFQWQGLNEIEAEGLADRLAARMIWIDATEETTDWAHIAPLAYFWFLARLVLRRRLDDGRARRVDDGHHAGRA